ncbi:copper amine oxidase N-terminal domain-containing protein [Paenibacillus sediminis]|uniref:Copper amine oxidase-like N-terminal domain-containing protein n=1 Tax=Paenibacillus sediminis TaxID=664909 RepID=A0ABS4H251_9BACL|nr:copper amine oxidase N-terminal domain-containing protein [Paenibacillus sediminis]MBP1936614.1 hypothetical protein [Paenibacillus sediminis]
MNTARKMGISIVALLLVLSYIVLPVSADSSAQNTAIIKIGSGSAEINGTKETIEKPYIDHGVTMVPLALFKKAFGTQTKLENGNVVKVLYSSHTISMTIGSNVAWVDGNKVKLEAAPRMVSDTLMVPLRLIAENIGASIKVSSDGWITIGLGASSEEAAKGTSGIDSDVGKKKVGNSYYQWSMNYPAELVIEKGTDESKVIMSEAEGSYYVQVGVTPQEVALSVDDLLYQAVEQAIDMGGTIVHRETFPQAKVPYARVVVKDGSGAFWELRQYYDHEQLYSVFLVDVEAVNYKDLNQFNSLLGSFTTSFNKADRSIKDLSTVVDGMHAVLLSDYGMMFSIPAEWHIDNENMYYESPEGSSLKVAVSSAPKGETLSGWKKQMDQWLQETYVQTAYRTVDMYSFDVAGQPALINEIQYNVGDGWTTEYDVYLQAKGYRYKFIYSVPEGQETDKDKFRQIMKSVKIAFNIVPNNFGYLVDDSLIVDKTKSTIVASKTYRYKLNIPTYWTAGYGNFDGNLDYQFIGGGFSLTADEDSTYEQTVARVKESYTGTYGSSSKLEKVEQSTFAGVPATVFTASGVKKRIPYTEEIIVFSNNGVNYTIYTSINDANRTDAQLQAIDRTLKSFEFYKK